MSDLPGARAPVAIPVAIPEAGAEPPDALFDAAPCGLLLMTLERRIIRANAMLAEWAGQPAEQLAGRPFHALLTTGTAILFETTVAPQLSLHGACDEISLDLRAASGALTPVSGTGRVRGGGAGQPPVVHLALFKAAERRRYERQLVEAHANSQAQERIIQGLLDGERATAGLREQFIAVLSHDLRSPLQAVNSGMRLIAPQLNDEGQMIVSMVQRSTGRMAELIRHVMDLAQERLGGGLRIESLSAAPLAAAIEDVVAETRATWPGRVIELEADGIGLVRSDPARIAQLLSNLLNNAISYGAKDAPIRVEARTEDGVFTLSVANAGERLPAGILQDLFQPYVRAKAKPDRDGLGLGLFIAAAIAKAHGGAMEVTSTDAQTRFTLRMPAGG